MKQALKLGCAALVAFGLFVGAAQAKYPDKTITIILPWSAGAGTDIQVRALAKEAEQILGVDIVVTNKTGGGGAVGLTQGMTAKPNGYTVTTVSIPLSIIPHVQDVPDFFKYDAFKPVLRYNVAPGTITVRSDSQWKTFEDFLSHAKAHPNELKIGTAPPGGAFNLVTHRLLQTLGVEAKQIGYKGSAPAVAALMGGHVEVTTFSPDSVLPQVKSGDFRVLAVLGKQRSAVLPDVPTLEELGYPLEAGTWRGFSVPKDTPDDRVKVLHDAFKQAMDSKAIQEQFEKMGVTTNYLGLAEFGEFMKQEYDVVGEVLEKIGMKKK